MTKIRTALVGCGKVGQTHARALSTLQESKFVAVCDRNTERAHSFGSRYGVMAYGDVEEMVTAEGVEAVSVTTPHPAHAAPVIEALNSGANVIVEKPLASSLSNCDRMIGAAREAGLTLAMISQRRLYTPIQRMRKAIDDGKLGMPILGTAIVLGWRDQAYYESDPWRGKWATEGGGVLINQASHQLDILQWLMGPIASVYGTWENFNHPYIEVEDTAAAIIHFENGGIGIVLASNSQNPGLYGKIAIHGQNGASIGAQTDGGSMFIAGMTNITEPPINDLWTISGEEDLLPKWQEEDARLFADIDPTFYYHKLQLQDFLQSIIEDREPLVTGKEGRKTVELFTAIYKSELKKRIIKFPVQASSLKARTQ